MDIHKAVELLWDYYTAAINNPHIRKKVAWALYHTWRDVDAAEKAVIQKKALEDVGNGHF